MSDKRKEEDRVSLLLQHLTEQQQGAAKILMDDLGVTELDAANLIALASLGKKELVEEAIKRLIQRKLDKNKGK